MKYRTYMRVKGSNVKQETGQGYESEKIRPKNVKVIGTKL